MKTLTLREKKWAEIEPQTIYYNAYHSPENLELEHIRIFPRMKKEITKHVKNKRNEYENKSHWWRCAGIYYLNYLDKKRQVIEHGQHNNKIQGLKRRP